MGQRAVSRSAASRCVLHTQCVHASTQARIRAVAVRGKLLEKHVVVGKFVIEPSPKRPQDYYLPLACAAHAPPHPYHAHIQSATASVQKWGTEKVQEGQRACCHAARRRGGHTQAGHTQADGWDAT